MSIRDRLIKLILILLAFLLGMAMGILLGYFAGWLLSVALIWLGVPITILTIMGLILLYWFVHESIKVGQ